jgi:hypothetical protein
MMAFYELIKKARGIVFDHRRSSQRHSRLSNHFRIQPAGLSKVGGFVQSRHIEEALIFWYRFSETGFSDIHILR